MKTSIILLVLLFAVPLYAQINKKMNDERSGKPILIGICDRTAFADTNYSWWFNAEYDNYQTDSSIVSKLKNYIKDYKIKIVMASWCGDSKREVPRFFKIIDEANYYCCNIELVNVDRNKQSLEGNLENLDIKFVPTFIFYKGEKEFGRIIEMPKGKLEDDILEIVRNN